MSRGNNEKVKKAEATRQKILDEIQYIESVEEQLQNDAEQQKIHKIRKSL